MEDNPPRSITKKDGKMSISKINNNTYVSIGMVVLLLAGIIRYEIRTTTLENLLKFHLGDPSIHYSGFDTVHKRLDKYEDSFLTKSEALLRLEKIEFKLEQIEKGIGAAKK